MQYKMFWTLFGTLLSLAAAVIPTIYGVAWWITTAAVTFAGIIVLAFTSSIVHMAAMFERYSDDRREQIATLCRIAVGSYILWTLTFVNYPSTWVLWVLWVFILIVISLTVYGAARYTEWYFSRIKPSKENDRGHVNDSIINNVAVKNFRSVLTLAGHERVRILRHEEVLNENGELEGNQFLVQTPPTG